LILRYHVWEKDDSDFMKWATARKIRMRKQFNKLMVALNDAADEAKDSLEYQIKQKKRRLIDIQKDIDFQEARTNLLNEEIRTKELKLEESLPLKAKGK
jgi:hypothetical protein